jgi:hypothetical protein
MQGWGSIDPFSDRSFQARIGTTSQTAIEGWREPSKARRSSSTAADGSTSEWLCGSSVLLTRSRAPEPKADENVGA